MIFTSFDYIVFLSIVFAAYWLIGRKPIQNPLLLAGSYIFYGYVHPWFCILVGGSTIMDFLCGLGMGRWAKRKSVFLVISLIGNLGLLGFFKYFNFFADNVIALAHQIGFELHPLTWRIFLPVGISFYTFQSLSYIIDVWRGTIKPCRNFIDFALYVCFFPQLVAGPIERPTHLLPQIQNPRRWNWDLFLSAWPLLIRGYLKKIVIADNVAVYVDKIFTLSHPSLFVLAAGTIAFALQIYSDFSAYTDIARGSARLIGFDLMENFKSPYLAISPSDFWRRWHISFSSWIRDYLYIPLGGSRVNAQWKYGLVLLATFGLSGFWHGASWHFVAWGIYHAVLLFVYHLLGKSGRWKPQTGPALAGAWALMSVFTLIGWMIFRAANLEWLADIFRQNVTAGLGGESLIVGTVVLAFVVAYSLPLFVLMVLDRAIPNHKTLHAIAYGFILVAIVLFAQDHQQDFIYFQF
jgi:alginate O-acetyltransferase complex protein AlgI